MSAIMMTGVKQVAKLSLG